MNTTLNQHRALPYYRWYPGDYRLSRRAQRLTYIERGLYRDLLDEIWLEGCIPDDIERLTDICNCPIGVMRRAWTKLRDLFEPLAGMDGALLTNPRIELERTELDAKRAQRKAAGLLSAKSRATVVNDRQRPFNALLASSSSSRGEKSTGKESTTTTTTTSTVQFLDGAQQEAYRAYRQTHHMPDGLDATLRAVQTAQTGGAAYDWPTIGQALVEMRGAEARFTANTLRAFCRRLKAGDPPPSANGRRPTDTRAALAEWVKDKEAARGQ